VWYALGITKAVVTNKGEYKVRKLTATYVGEAEASLDLNDDSIVWYLNDSFHGFNFLITRVIQNGYLNETSIAGYEDNKLFLLDFEGFKDVPNHAEALARIGYQVVA
jgi:hypothetical protein